MVRMTEPIPIEKRFRVLVEITRASHFAWREAALRLCPDVDAQKLVNEMWRITGEQTALAYLGRLDPGEDLPRQVAASIVWSSQCMGEDAELSTGGKAGEYCVTHTACPWHRWHEKHGVVHEDRPGCDAWFSAMIATINEQLGRNLRFETESALPDGDVRCRRRIWEDYAG